MRRCWLPAIITGFLFLLALSALSVSLAGADYSVLYGRWDPGSRVFWGDGVLSVGRQSIAWGRCHDLPYRIYSDQQLPIYPGNVLGAKPKPGAMWRVIVLEAAEHKCLTHGRYIQFAIPSDYQTHADIVIFRSAERLQKGEPEAAGVFGKIAEKK